MRIDPRHLNNLLAIAEHGTYRKAAAALGVSQPALSASIAELERQVGAPVLDRGRRGSALNEIGKILTRRARELRSLLREAGEEVRQKRLGQDGPLTIGITPSMANIVADAIAGTFAGRETSTVSVTAGMEGQLLAELVAGNIDFLLGPLPDVAAASGYIVEELLFEDPIVIFLSAADPLSHRRSLALEELRDLLWLVPQQASPYHDLMSSLLKAAGMAWPRRAIATNSLALSEALVDKMGAVMLGSRLQLTPGSPCRVVPLQSVAKRRIGLRYRRTTEPTPMSAALMARLREIGDPKP